MKVNINSNAESEAHLAYVAYEIQLCGFTCDSSTFTSPFAFACGRFRLQFFCRVFLELCFSTHLSRFLEP